MESRTADALETLVEVVRDNYEDAAPDDRVEAMLGQAESLLDEADEPGQDSQSTVYDRMRQALAQIVQFINTERPQLAGTMEVDRALDVLNNPVAMTTSQTSSVSSGQVGRATPYAEENQREVPQRPFAEMKRDEAKAQGKFVPEAARTPDEKRQEALDQRHMATEEQREREEAVEECAEEKGFSRNAIAPRPQTGFQAQDAKAQETKLHTQEEQRRHMREMDDKGKK